MPGTNSTLPSPGDPLSKTEKLVMCQLATGAANRVIGDRTYRTENTIKSHLRRVLAKLGATSRVEAVAEWLLNVSTEQERADVRELLKWQREQRRQRGDAA